MPDGSPIPPGLAHTLLVLATYWPNIWPSQSRLADDLNITRRQVNRRLLLLEDAGLILRRQRGQLSTRYVIDLDLIRRCDGSTTGGCDARVPKVVTSGPHKAQEGHAGNDEPGDGDEWDF